MTYLDCNLGLKVTEKWEISGKFRHLKTTRERREFLYKFYELCDLSRSLDLNN